MMVDRSDRGQAGPMPAGAGLCASCRHARLITNDRGSRFILCERAKTDPSFRRFPPLPMIGCPGYQAEAPATGC